MRQSAAAMAVIGVLLAGCAQDDGDSERQAAPTTTKASTTTTTTAVTTTVPGLTVEDLLSDLAATPWFHPEDQGRYLDELVADVRVSIRSISIESTEVGVFTTDGGRTTVVDEIVAGWAAQTCQHIIFDMGWEGEVWIDDAAGTEMARTRAGNCHIVQPG